MKILITGTAGFIGYHLVKKLVNQKVDIVGIDNINFYYDVTLKLDRLKESGIRVDQEKMIQSERYPNYRFMKMDLADKFSLDNLFATEKFDLVINLAAQAGVRYSISNPYDYAVSNLMGFLNIVEACRNYSCNKLIYASSSSVYGNSTEIPFTEEQRVDKPISLYAATKKSNELMANTYAELFGIDTVGLRFFTVYGPWGRPDMAPMLFAEAIANDGSIKVFNNGDLSRDFTYIDDIIEGICRIINGIDKVNGAEIYNIGHGKPVQLLEFIKTLEACFDKKVDKEYVGMQDGDVKTTYADTRKLVRDFDYLPQVDLKDGILAFVDWYKKYYISR